MKLRDIEVGGTYAVRAAAPTDRTRWFDGGTCAADLLRRPGEAQKLVLFCDAEVVAVAVPYKKGRQGVTFEGISERVVKCRCIDCGDEHP